MSFKRLVKGFIIAGKVIPETERRTGDSILQPKSPKRRHKFTAALGARISYARVYARDPQDTLEIQDQIWYHIKSTPHLRMSEVF